MQHNMFSGVHDYENILAQCMSSKMVLLVLYQL